MRMKTMTDEGSRRLEAAQDAARRVHALDGSLLADSEEAARSALQTARSAMDWLEDTDQFEEAHLLLHKLGQEVRATWGCQLGHDDRGYWRGCPVDLAHIRCGLSPGMVIGASECSVCHRDPADCDHITGRTYGTETCYRLITEVKAILEVSLVSRPAQPDARLGRVSISTTDLQDALGEEWAPGMPVSCDKCLLPCPGFTHPAG